MNGRKNKSSPIWRAVRLGFKLGVFILTAIGTVKIGLIAWATLQGRTGAAGGEMLILPLMAALIYGGWLARGEWTDIKKIRHESERSEYGQSRKTSSSTH